MSKSIKHVKLNICFITLTEHRVTVLILMWFITFHITIFLFAYVQFVRKNISIMNKS